MAISISITNLGEPIRKPIVVEDEIIQGDLRIAIIQIPVGWNVQDGAIIKVVVSPENK